jgi:hypothetical protein
MKSYEASRVAVTGSIGFSVTAPIPLSRVGVSRPCSSRIRAPPHPSARGARPRPRSAPHHGGPRSHHPQHERRLASAAGAARAIRAALQADSRCGRPPAEAPETIPGTSARPGPARSVGQRVCAVRADPHAAAGASAGRGRRVRQPSTRESESLHGDTHRASNRPGLLEFDR